MGLNDISMTDGILPYVATFSSGLLILLIRQIITGWNKYKDRREKRTVWIKFLQSNEIINKCLLDFEKISDPGEGHLFSMLVGTSLGFISVIVLFNLFNHVLRNQWLSMAYSNLIYIAPFISK